ncbi:MAG: aromatic ring-hydroxylating oxygenase subunit alpha [Alphaproteobacteria bacterium]
MQHAEQIRVLKTLMTHLDNGTNVDAGGIMRTPVSTYTCPEWEVMFRDYPQVVGLSGDLPSPGNFFTLNNFGVPVLATRDKAGKFRAFINVCTHRGTIVETEARGTKSKFSCPFHGWTYTGEGALMGIPKADHFGDLDKACLNLTELPAVEALGILWVHPKPDGVIHPDALLGGLAPEFDAWSFDEMTYMGCERYDTEMNWKLAIDTFGETYHFSTLHRNSLYPAMYGNVQAYDIYDRNHRMSLCYRSIDELRDKPESDWHISKGCLPVYYLFPNIQVNVSSNGLVLVRVYPDGDDPRQSYSEISFYGRGTRSKGEAESLAMFQRAFAGVIRDEDYVVAAGAQIGADQGQRDTVIFGRNEPALHHYHSTYRRALGLEPLPVEAV